MSQRSPIGPAAARMAVAAVVLLLIIGCSADSTPAPRTAGKRYASFAPSVTQMLADLGQTDRIVAVGAFDPVRPPGAAVVGDLYQVDYEKLLKLRPTNIFLQPGRQGVPPRLAELAARHGWAIHNLEIETRDDVLRALGGAVAEATGEPAAAQKLRDHIQRQWNAIAALTTQQPAKSVLLVVGRDPITAAGPDTFVSQMAQAAGGRNALAAGSMRYPVLDRERLLALNIDVVLRFRPRSGDAMGSVAAGGSDLELPESMSRTPVIVIDDPAALLPSSTMPRIVAQIARALHPQLVGGIDAIMAETPR